MPRPAGVEPGPEPRTREVCSGIASLVSEDGVAERPNALFAATDGPHGTIYILDADTIDGASHYDDAHENPLWREILLHELVHHAQAQHGAVAGWECQRGGLPTWRARSRRGADRGSGAEPDVLDACPFAVLCD
ncbi:hypothetical protein SAMN04488105_111169 [Salipiger thiooxidans]|uniref:Uncharacterized protein n=1 Tax=Salipiger thiooxidans TaxID=282683 RepID=A0A1G7HUB9_9RHOB|nr:hypothetical protein [Salipiger thiooxidans]SDF04030.1 hypothetical protein SAMN04488105_111169 [Salipiger thiooxidans]